MDNTVATANQAPTIDVSPHRHSMVQRTTKDRMRFFVALVRGVTAEPCTCDQCSFAKCVPPHLVCTVLHEPDEIVVRPNWRPVLVSKPEYGTYDALKLARSAIATFSRPEAYMPGVQQEQMRLFRRSLKENNIMERLGKSRPSDNFTDEALLRYAKMLNDIFFLGAVKKFHISWWHEVFDEKAVSKPLGDTQSYTSEGKRQHNIRIHARHTRYDAAEYPISGITLAEERLGTILHELLHAFLNEFSCSKCPNYLENLRIDGHGRAWQLVAKAVEEQSLRLLGTEAYLGRLSSYFTRRLPANQHESKTYTPSTHDLKSFGFLEL